jgi:hypothetical protein
MNEPLLIFVLVGVLNIVLGVPMLLRRVPPNPFYGLRVSATFKDEQVWYDANAASGRDLIVLGVCMILLAIVPPALGWRGDTHFMTWGFSLAAGALLMAIIGWRRANRMLKEKNAASNRPS